MKDFLKYALASATGIILTVIILFFIGICILFSILVSSETETQVKRNSIMMLDLKGTLSDRCQEWPLDVLLGEEYSTYGLDDILASIRKAKNHPDIKGIYLQAGYLQAGYAALWEIRKELLDFKESGKFIVAYGDNYTQGLYYLASVADRIILNPQGMIEWKGLASAPIFYKELLQKIGVEMQVFKVGTYKAAVEPYTTTEMSPANREQLSAFLSSAWRQITSEVAISRKLPEAVLNNTADKMPMFQGAEKIIEYGLADTLMYKYDIRDYLKTLVGIRQGDDLHVLGLQEMINLHKNVPKDPSGNIIAVYYATGEIVDNGQASPLADGEPVISAEKITKDLRKLKEDRHVKAVVLRVNSPGGSAYASEQIWHAVKQLKAEKPVVVSMGDYAASGGYYISCIADSIVAEPLTLTGSIGIFGMMPNIKGLANKLGVNVDVVKTNTYADFGLLSRPMNDGEKNLMQHYIECGYDTFLSRCSEGRHLSKEAIDKIAQGRIWDGHTAVQIGLADEVGGVDRAIEMAVAKAGIENYTLISYPEEEGFWNSLINNMPDNYIRTRLLKGKAGSLYKSFSIVEQIDQCARIQARIPFALNIE